MHCYRFRILTDEQDDFVRDIDLLANQTFEDFHHAMVSSIKLNGNELASFFICDHRWRKQKELTLIDMKADEVFDEDEDDLRDRKNMIPVALMAEVRIKDAIVDPHQRLIYEYDFLNPKVFFVELIKIQPADASSTYPQVVRSEGELQKVPEFHHFHKSEPEEELMLKDIESLDDEFTIDEDDFEISASNETSW